MKIKAFNAMHPDPAWYNSIMSGTTERQHFRQTLEPVQNDSVSFDACKVNLNTLKNLGKYKQEEVSGIYIYEKETAYGSQFGVWVLTSLEDMISGNIVTHERTLEEREDRLKAYRKGLGLEGSPILLTYRKDSTMTQLIEKVAAFPPIVTLIQDRCNHKVWKIRSQETILEFTSAFQNIKQAYVADGHHRLAVAAAEHHVSPQWISTLYVSSGQISCREFHRMVCPESPLDTNLLLEKLSKQFYISEVPNNVAYKPSRSHRFGMQHKCTWYQLDLKPEYINELLDVQILQEMVLSPLFGIHDPTTDQRLRNFPANKWEDLLNVQQEEPESITFTLFPMSAEALIQQADKQHDLPPKSTYIEPKVPFGLLLYQNETTEKISSSSPALH
ncbi:DUF1015 domain-containing protein [Pedobacter nutrimenti]|uniref:DUF1015 domain-containing protein n=1 Tax=Pedobacter nutrimenti TaxID=1241337 RepID=UPI002931CC16|nr:DUF1015 domain-containing protein [Pedobacter nutrimenti]